MFRFRKFLLTAVLDGTCRGGCWPPQRDATFRLRIEDTTNHGWRGITDGGALDTGLGFGDARPHHL